MTTDPKQPRPVVYIASPIDQAGTHAIEIDQARYDARSFLAGELMSFYDPKGAWHATTIGPTSRAIQRVNDIALAESDGMLALLPAGVPTVGVPYEIALALQYGIPVMVVTPKPPTALLNSAAMFSPNVADAVERLALKLESVKGEPAASETLMFQLTQSDAQVPTRAYAGDAGYDLYVTETTEVPPLSVIDVPSGVAAAIPFGHYGRIVGRSSTHRKRGLSVIEGIIDAGYRGPLYSCVWNPSSTDTVTIERGERVAQLIVTPVSDLQAKTVDVLPNSDRGAKGFGSSGRSELSVR